MIRKLIKLLFRLIIILFVVANIYMAVTGKWFLYKAVVHQKADIDDYKIFENRTVANSSTPEDLPNAVSYNKNPLSDSLTKTLEETETVAFLMLKNDSVVQEHYWKGYNKTSYSNSFSMSKSVIGMLIGVAIGEGKIKSIDDKVLTYLPEIKGKFADKLTIRHLLMMSSGSSWDESYSSAFSITTEAYYGFDLAKTMAKVTVDEEPGKLYNYKSGDSEWLGMIIEKATGKKVAEYASEKLWKPVHANLPALWSLDKKDGQEKCYCCLNSNARDFSRIGTLYLHQGNWKGTQLVDSAWVKYATTANMLPGQDGSTTNFYANHWWVYPDAEMNIFYARGLNGQYIIVIPSKNIVMVRLGNKKGAKVRTTYTEVEAMIKYALTVN